MKLKIGDRILDYRHLVYFRRVYTIIEDESIDALSLSLLTVTYSTVKSFRGNYIVIKKQVIDSTIFMELHS